MLLHRPIRDQTQTNLRRTARLRWLPMSALLRGCVKTPLRSESPYASNPPSAQQLDYPVLTAMSCLDASPTSAAGARRGAHHAGVRETCTLADISQLNSEVGSGPMLSEKSNRPDRRGHGLSCADTGRAASCRAIRQAHGSAPRNGPQTSVIGR
jgi:hypothetical protein